MHFPRAKAGNAIRGALGIALRQGASPEIFETLFPPAARRFAPPSSLADPPRPFVLRASHLDGLHAAPGGAFHFDVHTFDPVHPPLVPLRRAFDLLAASGIGPGRGRAILERVEQLDFDDHPLPVDDLPAAPPLVLDLGAVAREPVLTLRLLFLTPTELKGSGELVDRPEFPVLFARLRGRICALGELYGNGAPGFDSTALSECAHAVQLTRSSVVWRRTDRRSSRTGQVHPLGGFTGEADYAGDLGVFLPWLAAARWTGVGRHTVWGQGDIRIAPDRPAMS